MINKIFPIVLLVAFLTTLILTITQFAFALLFGTVTIFLSLSYALYSIFQKHKDSENPRTQITKAIIKFIALLLIISFLGGLVGMFANFYVGNWFGLVAGLVSAILSAFVVGYLVKRASAKIFGE